jgi:hypothetical protein
MARPGELASGAQTVKSGPDLHSSALRRAGLLLKDTTSVLAKEPLSADQVVAVSAPSM